MDDDPQSWRLRQSMSHGTKMTLVLFGHVCYKALACRHDDVFPHEVSLAICFSLSRLDLVSSHSSRQCNAHQPKKSSLLHVFSRLRPTISGPSNGSRLPERCGSSKLAGGERNLLSSAAPMTKCKLSRAGELFSCGSVLSETGTRRPATRNDYRARAIRMALMRSLSSPEFAPTSPLGPCAVVPAKPDGLCLGATASRDGNGYLNDAYSNGRPHREAGCRRFSGCGASARTWARTMIARRAEVGFVLPGELERDGWGRRGPSEASCRRDKAGGEHRVLARQCRQGRAGSVAQEHAHPQAHQDGWAEESRDTVGARALVCVHPAGYRGTPGAGSLTLFDAHWPPLFARPQRLQQRDKLVALPKWQSDRGRGCLRLGCGGSSAWDTARSPEEDGVPWKRVCGRPGGKPPTCAVLTAHDKLAQAWRFSSRSDGCVWDLTNWPSSAGGCGVPNDCGGLSTARSSFEERHQGSRQYVTWIPSKESGAPKYAAPGDAKSVAEGNRSSPLVRESRGAVTARGKEWR
ncbi:hypothetical protein C8R45DRAFT_1157752 [Mycena sanguinolenta]|nr:hypothetical protein C8R45DRAFT_1157752 [Mycena sanguinolenta]